MILSLFEDYFMGKAKESRAEDIADKEFLLSDLWFYGIKLGLVYYFHLECKYKTSSNLVFLLLSIVELCLL